MSEPEASGIQVALRQAAPIPLSAALACAPGELTALIGPSGSGKTSILRCIAGLLRPRGGRIACDGQVWLDSERGIALSPQARRVGLVFQDCALFPHLSALDEVITRPASREVARLVGQRNLFEGWVLGPASDGPGRLLLDWEGRRLAVEEARDLAPGTQVDWMVPASAVLWQRPDRPMPGDRENPVEARALDRLALGDTCTLIFLVEGPGAHRLFFHLPAHVVQRHGLAAGDRARVSLLAAGIHLMPRGE